MSKWINFAEIRNQVSLEDVLFRFYQITTLKRDGDKLVGPCPAHGGDNPRAFQADLGRNIWKCFTRCGKGGNQIDFVVARENISVRDAALKLHAFFIESKSEITSASGPKPKETTRTGEAKKQTPAREKELTAPAKNAPLALSLSLKADHRHLTEDRKLKLETLSYFGVGYCPQGTLRGSIAIPIHDEEGNLIAYAGRRLKKASIEEYGKYVFPKGFRKELVLYNFHRAKEAMPASGLILVEGFFAVMKLYELGYRNAVAAMGSEVSDEQAMLLAQAPDVILLFDGDEAGQKGIESAKSKLTSKTIIRVVRLPAGSKPDEIDERAIRWALNGMRGLDLLEVGFTFAPEK